MLNVLHCFSQSGLGDLGIAGLEDFIESLTCTQISNKGQDSEQEQGEHEWQGEHT